jgi:hypothetical protein
MLRNRRNLFCKNTVIFAFDTTKIRSKSLSLNFKHKSYSNCFNSTQSIKIRPQIQNKLKINSTFKFNNLS